MATIFGGASAPPSRRRAELLWKEVCAASPASASSQLLKWSGTPITFVRSDHPDNTAGVGLLFVVVTPMICNLRVGRVLVDGGARLNLLSPEVFHKMQIGEHKLLLLMPFYGVTDGNMLPLGQIELPIMFGGRDNFCMENVVFDVAHIDLPYNAILGCPALA